MQNLSIGQKAPLPPQEASGTLELHLDFNAPGLALDIALFGLDAAEKLSDEAYMVFYNQKSAPGGACELFRLENGKASFRVRLGLLPDKIEKLTLVASIDGQGQMSQIQNAVFQAGTSFMFSLKGSDFAAEKAVMVAEIYKKSGQWRVFANGQGFNGGLGAVLRHFGGTEAEAPAAPARAAAPEPAMPPAAAARLSLEKRIQEKAPQLVSLVKKANIVLEKRGLSAHKAKVALCLDISASMDSLYKKGMVQQLADKVMALATRFDDDGELDVFLFGEEGHCPEPMKIENCSGYVRELIASRPLESGTRYHKAMKLIRERYFGTSQDRRAPLKSECPVYVMFITDGGTSNRESAIAQVRSSSFEPIFWQFMGLGSADFGFLEKLDDLDGRFVDNADFFTVADPSKMGDEELFEKMMNEYPGWVKLAAARGLL